MFCKRNGESFVDVDEADRPLHYWRGDLWACPVCGAEIIVGVVMEGVGFHERGFEELVEHCEKAGDLHHVRQADAEHMAAVNKLIKEGYYQTIRWDARGEKPEQTQGDGVIHTDKEAMEWQEGLPNAGEEPEKEGGK
jgi:hypothetical protein